MKINKILLVGGTGYIGTALYQILKKDYRVHVTGRLDKPEFGNDFRNLNFANSSSIKHVLGNEKYDLIIILAAQKEIKITSEIDFGNSVFKDNVLDLNTFFKFLFKFQDKATMLFVSSMTVYGPQAVSPVSEDVRLSPIHDYGLSKLIGESFFSYYVSYHDSYGVVFRIPGVFGGSRKSGYIFNLIKKMKNNESVEIDSTDLGYWEAINLNDLVNIFAEFIRKYPAHNKVEIFNLSYGEETDFVKTAYLLKDLLNSKSEIRVAKKDYRRFFLDNRKVSQFVDTRKYSYLKALKRYIKEFK